MGIDLGGGFGAGGAVEGLQALLQQRQLAAQLAESVRSHQADEAIRQQQLEEQTKFREMQQQGLQQDRAVNEGARLAGTLSPGDSLLNQPNTVNRLVQGGQGPNIGVVPPLHASPIPSGASVPSLPSGSDSGAAGGGDVLRTGPSMQAPLQQPKPGEIGNVSWLGTPQERKAQDAERSQSAFLRTLDPNSQEGKDAIYQARMGHPRQQTKDPAQALQDKKDLMDYAAALRPAPPDHFSPVGQFDETGKPIGTLSFDTRTGGVKPVIGPDGKPLLTKAAPGAAAAVKDAADVTKAKNAIKQVDSSLDTVKDLVGPAAGRGETVEQWLGTADPKIQAFGTKLLLAKMIIDKAVTGSARAGASAPLLARWDNFLGNKVSYEGMKSALQAADEIIGGGATSPAPQAPAGWKYVPKAGGGWTAVKQ